MSAARGPTLRLVCVNDVYQLDNLPRLRTLVKTLAAENPADLLLVTLAGDFLAPSLLSSLDHGAAMVECLNEVPVTHVILGNHEDDVPFTALQSAARAFRGCWINTNVPGFTPSLPRNAVLTLTAPGGRTVKVGLVGVLTEDPALYRPGAFNGLQILPANESAVAEGTALRAQGCGALIAMTHQAIARDRVLAAQREAPFSLVIGGHEHEPHLEHIDGCWLVKAGSEAAHAVVIDLAWPASPPPAGELDAPTAEVRLEDVRAVPADPALASRVAHHMVAVEKLRAAELMRIPEGEALSSVGVRWRQTSMGTLVCSRLRQALDADACVLNGGGIRASTEHRGAFTYGDLESELPFANEVVVVPLPGWVLRDTIATSRSRAPTPWAAFLQVDDGVQVDAEHGVIAVNGEPLDERREYRVAMVRLLVEGLDGLEPLLRFMRDHPERMPPRDSGREIKTILVETFALDFWRSLGDFDLIDTDRDGLVSADEIRAAIARRSEAAAGVLFDSVMRALDVDGDARVSREEAERVKVPAQ
ncbi:MAG: 5'-nucleotidase C-terminal domain-containing protein [Polyangiales bacterium]